MNIPHSAILWYYMLNRTEGTVKELLQKIQELKQHDIDIVIDEPTIIDCVLDYPSNFIYLDGRIVKKRSYTKEYCDSMYRIYFPLDKVGYFVDILSRR